MKTLVIIGIMLTWLLFLYPQLLFAQPPSFDNDTSDVPIDGGLSILLALGIGYGIKKNLNHQAIDKKNKPAPKD
jgi:hypothetical protein